MKINLTSFLILSTILFYSNQSFGQVIELSPKFDTCYIDLDDNEYSFIPPKRKITPSTKAGSNIVINYNGYPPQAIAAFEYATAIWENEIISTVPIVINATYTNQGFSSANTIAFASTPRLTNVPNAPSSSLIYNSALADAIAGVDLRPGQADFNITFNSGFNFYFGTDGQPAAGQTDFVTIALHEMGHGFGFSGNAGLTGISTGIYDTYIETGEATPVLNLPFGSAAQIATLTSNNLFWNGFFGKEGLDGDRPRIYAPITFSGGSTYSHLDEVTYPRGTPHALMTPFNGSAEVAHDIGSVTRGMFKDMGWILFQDVAFNVRPIALSLSVTECELSTETPFSVTIRNSGNSTLNDVPVSVQALNNDVVVSQTTFNVSSIAVGEDVTFEVDLDLTNFDIYSIEAITQLSNDQNIADDLISIEVEDATPSIAPSGLVLDNSTLLELGITWQRGNGEGSIVLLKKGSDFTAADMPVNGISYSFNPNIATSTSTIGNAFVIYRGTSLNNIIARDLEATENYFVTVLEFSCNPPVFLRSNALNGNSIVTNLAEETFRGLSVYPNPVNRHQLSIEIPNYQGQVDLKILSSNGIEVSSFNTRLEGGNRSIILDTQSLTGGLYLVKIQTSNGVITRKIAIE